jgi:hypothetical protein
LLSLVLGATLLLEHLHTTLAEKHAAQWALDLSNVLSHRVALGVLLLAGEFTIRKWLWRVEKPHLDFSGRWSGATEYKERWLAGSGQLPDKAEHEVDIKQDCLSVTIAPTMSETFAQWHSLICDLPANGGIAYTYKVTYKDNTGLPPSARGYETLQVVRSGARGRPQAIAGEFHQLVSNDKPIFSGVAHFERVRRRRARISPRRLVKRRQPNRRNTPQT